MPRRCALVSQLALFLFVTAWLFADNEQRIIPVESDAYAALESLYLEQGLVPPSTAAPYSVDELHRALQRIDPSRLSDAGRASYDYLRSLLSHRTLAGEGRRLQFDATPTLTAAGYAQSDAAAGSGEKAWTRRPAAFNLPLELWLFDNLYADLELPIVQDPFVAQLPEGASAPADYPSNPTNVPLSSSQIEFDVPFRALLSLGGADWNVEFGRDNLRWGNGEFGNLVLSDNSDYYDFLRLTTYWRAFKLTSVYIGLPPYWAGQTNEVASATPDAALNIVEPYKAFLGHRLEFRLFDRASIALSESLLTGGAYPQLADFNPLMIFHDWFVWERAKAQAAAELSVTPYRWLNLYGQLAMDQYQTQLKIEEYNTSTIPNALGYIAGATAAYPIGPGYLTARFQFTRTDPWMYIGGGGLQTVEPWVSYDDWHRIISNVMRAQLFVVEPLGWLYGPDSQVYDASLAYESYGRYRAGAELRIQQQGANTILTPNQIGAAAAAMTTPSTTAAAPVPIDTQVVHLFGSWKIGRMLGIDTSIGSDLYLVYVQNQGHVAGANTTNVQLIGQITLSY